MRELFIPDSRKWFVTPDPSTNVIDDIWGPSRYVMINDKNCEVNLIV